MEGQLLVLLVIVILMVATLIWMFAPRKTDRLTYERVLYAKKGEIITCTNDHEICELAKDVYVGGLLVAEEFINWRNQEPAKPCDVITPCKTCGEPFIKSAMPYGGNHLHIAGEWRTVLTPCAAFIAAWRETSESRRCPPVMNDRT